MSGKKPYDFRTAFDDSKLPVNDLSIERMEEIEKLATPLLKEAAEKLWKEQPHLFKPKTFK